MVNTSKILTVSYGTFSCTLEGFDDSFEMMKAIAEYFRDLAQDDRYFGAEPPTPDAEMLARIAEREAARRVDAREEQGAIVLRPSAEPAAAVAAQPEVTQPAPVIPQAPAAEQTAAPAPVADPIQEAAHPEEQPDEEMLDAGIPDEGMPAQETLAQELLAEELSIEAPATEDAPAAPAFDEESVAAKLSRIRAVVSRGKDEQPPAPDYSEDQHAEDFEDDTAASIATALREPEAPALDLDDMDDLDDLENEPLEFDVAAAEDPQLAEDIAEASETPAEAEEPPLHARVIRMKRTDFEAALAEGQIESDAPTPVLSDADEAELLQELAEVEAELNLTADPAPAEPPEEELTSIFAEDTQEIEEAPAHTGKAETDVGRLMDKAAEEMDRPDGAHRRSAIAHLRAAVQATRAETEAGGGLNRGDDSLNAYRDDLNRVVRPRRPRPATGADQDHEPRRPAMKPAPLKLVAEQRIDTDTPAEAAVVRPRRVSVHDAEEQTPAPDGEASSFVEFAQQAGVKDLSELMEAAAAYMSYVEGRQKFSRPQLMNKARQVEEYRFSREDGLRSFGQLLRQGKIEKLKGGRFTVSDDLIGFKPDARAAG
ncbi:hypothetical protein ACSSNL_02845 [Thalassobius sp. S69A]|uniref:hypothetical protein n=1 Tax=unclassified Thalassovita TaxID=2619711 RepID=UPI000C3D0391|nr:hypothetical protein [Paracoccaceae bacterium]